MTIEVLGIGALLLDQILPVDSVSGTKGGMELVGHQTIENIIASASGRPTPIAGGSGTNTIKGLANLGHKCAFVGKLGKDAAAKLIEDNLKQAGVTPITLSTATPTGQALCMITPDGERTMRTYPGGAAELKGKDLNPDWFKGVSLVHIEGYTLLNDDLAERAMVLAGEAGAKISFDLASFEIATQFRDKIFHLLEHHIDILFANALETKALTGYAPERGADLLADLCETAVVYLGGEGGFVAQGDEKIRYPAFEANPLDTTGAGDLFASGFLHGMLLGLPLQECARRGAITGSTVVEILGAEIPPELWKRVKTHFSKTSI